MSEFKNLFQNDTESDDELLPTFDTKELGRCIQELCIPLQTKTNHKPVHSVTPEKKIVELADQRDMKGTIPEHPRTVGKEDQCETKESYESPSDKVKDLFFAIYTVENEICEIEGEIQRQPKDIDILLETENVKLYNLLDFLYGSLPTTDK